MGACDDMHTVMMGPTGKLGFSIVKDSNNYVWRQQERVARANLKRDREAMLAEEAYAVEVRTHNARVQAAWVSALRTS